MPVTLIANDGASTLALKQPMAGIDQSPKYRGYLSRQVVFFVSKTAVLRKSAVFERHGFLKAQF